MRRPCLRSAMPRLMGDAFFPSPQQFDCRWNTLSPGRKPPLDVWRLPPTLPPSFLLLSTASESLGARPLYVSSWKTCLGADCPTLWVFHPMTCKPGTPNTFMICPKEARVTTKLCLNPRSYGPVLAFQVTGGASRRPAWQRTSTACILTHVQCLAPVSSTSYWPDQRHHSVLLGQSAALSRSSVRRPASSSDVKKMAPFASPEKSWCLGIPASSLGPPHDSMTPTPRRSPQKGRDGISFCL